jgi:hypothetical protein
MPGPVALAPEFGAPGVGAVRKVVVVMLDAGRRVMPKVTSVNCLHSSSKLVDTELQEAPNMRRDDKSSLFSPS